MAAALLAAAAAVGAVALTTTFFTGAGARANQIQVSHPGNQVRFRITFGLNDRVPTRWDGAIRVAPGTLDRVEGWLTEDEDQVNLDGWKLTTRRARPLGEPADLIPPDQWPIIEVGVVVAVTRTRPDSRVEVETPAGPFAFRLVELQYARQLRFLDDAIAVERIPAGARLTQSAEDQDFPAAAVAPDGTVWVAYVEFAQNAEYERRRFERADPNEFSYLAAPPGGDQIFLIRYSSDRWTGPIAVSDPGADIYRCAVAVDGAGRAWVVWSENKRNNFDLYARIVRPDGSVSAVQRVTASKGSDLDPVATSDSNGRVWIAWQGFGERDAEIFVARQEGDVFAEAVPITSSPANEWHPAIAADPRGSVAVAWDSYSKGDYDVYFRVADIKGRFGPATLAAGSPRFEARPSAVYDKAGRLWLAWEESAERWGKDFGAYESSGTGLYHSRYVVVRAFDGSRALQPATGPGPALLGNAHAAQSDVTLPDASLAIRRPPHLSPQVSPLSRNSFPRLIVDKDGRLWIAYRSIWPALRYQIRSFWYENLASFDGERWHGPIFMADSDNLLDNRPALVALADGRLLAIHSRDYRAVTSPRAAPIARVNNDLYASEISLAGRAVDFRLVPANAEGAVPLQPVVAAERNDIARARAVRTVVGGRKLQLLRGEFHRHTDISLDGSVDGSLDDMWRYALDVADMDWIGNGDHDNGGGREYYWWLVQKTTDAYTVPAAFVPMFTYERSLRYPQGHRNVIFASRGVRPLPRLQRLAENDAGPDPDALMLYRYLKQFNGVCSSHTSATDMGTDWRAHDSAVETSVEIYQGDRQNYEMPGAPRSNREDDSIGGWRPKGFVSNALDKGFRLAFQASSDHYSNHISYCNIWSEAPTREAILQAFKRRHLYGATDNIIAIVRSGQHFMGDEFATDQPPVLQVELTGTAPFARVHIIRNGKYVYTVEPRSASVRFEWRDANPVLDKTSYYYVRGEQQDGEIVWASPMWIRYTGR